MQQLVIRLLRNKNLMSLLFCMAVITGPVLTVLFQYDLSQYTDCQTYLGLAELDLDQSPVRRYRIIIPMLARGIHLLTGGMLNVFAPTYFIGDFSLPFSFAIVNTILMCITGIMVYKYCRSYASSIGALMGLLVFLENLLGCRVDVVTAKGLRGLSGRDDGKEAKNP